ncbi:25321_t:CDS:10 [Dentiscutata erythropus]|uniref:25321_t:CDS:1 n=1 Tax=Dentiscutata erythropus TaxID=1348616 RepID=A0A9N9CU77_9GLOM|nr:25321_t:CDS:10 [Dentiscutata erythropus]
MTAVLRSKKFLEFKVPTSENTHCYFKKIPAQHWQLKHYLSFRLKSDESILPWSTVYDNWQKSLDFIAKNSNKKFPGSISSLCIELRNICNTYEGSIVIENCEKLYEEFYQRNIDLQIAERLRLLDTTIFSEQKFSEFLRTSGKKRIGEDNEEASSSEKRIRYEGDHVDNFAPELLKDHEEDYDDEISDVNVVNFLNEENELEEVIQPEAVQVANSPFEEWVLSTGKNVSQVLDTFRAAIPKSKAYLYPAFFGILDLSGEDTEVKKLFTDDEWSEMKNDFNETVEFKDIDEETKLYDLFDKIQETIEKKPDDLITAIEKCTIEGSSKVNSIRRLIQTYAYNMERLQTSIPEAMFSNNFTNMLTKGILTYHRKFMYDEGEIQSLASAFITNTTKKPTDRSLIGQKCDFRVTCDGFEIVIGLRSGGLPEACKSKKWNDKVDLMVAMRDVLLREAIENNGVECTDFKRIYTLGVHSFGFFYNVYAMDWKSKGLWRLGLLKKAKLPQSNEQLLMIEKLVVTLLQIESTLNHIVTIRNDLVIKASRLHRERRTSVIPKQYTVCEQRVHKCPCFVNEEEINRRVKKEVNILCQRLLEHNEKTFGKFMREITMEHEDRVKANKKLRFEVEEKKIELQEAEKCLAYLKSRSIHQGY